MKFRLLEKSDVKREDFWDLLKQLTDKPIDWHVVEDLRLDRNFVGVIIETDDGKIIGYGSMSLYRSLVKGVTAVLEDLVIEEAYRGKGIGGKLYDLLEEEVSAMGVRVLTLTSNPKREGARAMYLKRGYEMKETGFFVKIVV